MVEVMREIFTYPVINTEDFSSTSYMLHICKKHNFCWNKDRHGNFTRKCEKYSVDKDKEYCADE